jgi:hypothetical protein
MKVTDEMVEAGAHGMYGKNWNGPPERRPGEQMKDVWRKLARACLEGAIKDIVQPPIDGEALIASMDRVIKSLENLETDPPKA